MPSLMKINGRNWNSFLPIFHLLSLLIIIQSEYLILSAHSAAPLSTNSRWIIDGKTGSRVKLACVNWPSHLEPVLAEGLSKQPVNEIAGKIRTMGFNCVRLTWPIYLTTNDSLADMTVRDSFQRLGLSDDVSGLQKNNPKFVEFSLIRAFQAVVNVLGNNSLMVILDNHLTKPGWCCGYSDGNGFFGDEYFDPQLWLSGLTKMATLFKSTPTVIGMSLRNELRGARQNVNDWYTYMQMGAEAVHAANPQVLVIISGLSYDTDLSFLHTRSLNLTFTGKVVFEAHWYSFSNSDEAWKTGNANRVCGSVKSSLMWRFGYLLEKGWPLILSEFGLNLQGEGDVSGERYLGCFMSVAAELDFDWAIWVVAGSYYLREGVAGMEEFYGVLDRDWKLERNQSFLQKISFIQSPLRGPGGDSQSKQQQLIFHPTTGLCVLRKAQQGHQLELGSCLKSEAWTYTPEKRLIVMGTNRNLCLRASENGKPVTLGLQCQGSGTSWEPISDSKMHLSTYTGGDHDRDATQLCLDVGDDNGIVATECKCLRDEKNGCDPERQWFKMIETFEKLLGGSGKVSWVNSVKDRTWKEFTKNLGFAYH